MVRAVTTDFDLSWRPGSKIWLHVLTYATNPVPVAGSPVVEYGSIGLGLGLALGLLLAAGLDAFPGERTRPEAVTA